MANKQTVNDYSIKSYPDFVILNANRIITEVITGYGKEITDKYIRTKINELLE